VKRTIYVCPEESCAYLSMTPGKCRSHPYPRAMGPELVPLEVVPASSDDPRRAGGQMIDAGDSHTRGQVMFDTRNAVLVERIETAVGHTTQRGEPGHVVALSIHGRINRPPDDEMAAERPAEQVSHLHMMSWDAAADLVVDIQSLAARDGFELTSLLEEKWAEAESKGLTRRAPGV
jgi:hypothetical protein